MHRALLVALQLLTASALAGLCDLGAAHAQSDEALAQQLYRQARRAYDQGDHASALRRFRASLAAYDSPNARLYVARSLRELGRLGEAVLEYHLTASAAADLEDYSPRYAETRRAALQELDALRPRVGSLRVLVRPAPPDLAVTVAGREVSAAALDVPLPVTPGTVEVRARAPGFEVAGRTIEVAAGESREVILELSAREVLADEPPEPEEAADVDADGTARLPEGPDGADGARPDRTRPAAARGSESTSSTLGWIGVIAGGAAVAAGGVLAVLAERQYRDLSNDCGDEPCPASRAGDVDYGRTMDAASIVAFGAGGALLLGGVLWLLLTGEDGAEAPASAGFDGEQAWLRIAL